MANSTNLLKFSLKTNIVKSIFFEIVSKVSRYYYTFGKTTQWPTVTGVDTSNQTYTVSGEEDPPAAVDSYPYELETRRNIIYTKNIDSNDAAIVVTRYDWSTGFIYDMYDNYSVDKPSYNGAQSLDQALFYVLTSDYNVYKCLFNNNNAPSLVQPSGTSPEPITLSDGYIWKFMYSIPLALRNKFLTTSNMPVVTALSNQFYSNGTIVSYSIENRGKNYIKNTWKVNRFTILNGGKNYTTSNITITFPMPSVGTDRATAVVNSVGDNGNVLSILVTNAGSGYSTQPIPTIESTIGVGLQYVIDYDKDDSAYTQLKITGDGYNELNPYSLKNINILERGVFTSAPSGDLFTFPSPSLQYGYRPEVAVTFRQISGSSPATYEVDTITVTNTGYGYSEPLVFAQNVFAGPLTSDSSGFSCDLDLTSQKNEADLIPLINASGEIEAIQIVNAGVGYTYALVEVVAKKMVLMIPEDPLSGVLTDLDSTNTDGFVKASIILNFGIGDIETKQSNVELLAVDGSIPIINIDFGGSGYPANSIVEITGDGSGCTADLTVVGGKITKITVTNPGYGYTSATATVSAGGIGAALRPIISPRGGHGKDAISELYAKTIALVSRLSLEKNKGVVSTNDYRQISILKNIKQYNQDAYYKNATGSSCALLICDITSTNTNTYNNLSVDDTLYFNETKTFTLVEKTIISNKYYLVVQVNDNFIPLAGNTIYKVDGVNSYLLDVSTVEQPDVNKFSGEMLYIDNRVKFTTSSDQSIVTTTLISF